jgi:adenosine deaminase
MRDLRALPKAELHIHLEGSIRVETLRELADRSGGALPHGLRRNTWRFDGFLDFIQNYSEACALLNRPEDFRRLAEEFCEDLAIAGVPVRRSGFQPGEPCGAAAGLVRPDRGGAGRSGGGPAGPRRGRPGVPDVVRDLGMDEAERTLEVATKFSGQGVVALNAAGSERAPVAAFASVFERGARGRAAIGPSRRGVGRARERLADPRALRSRPDRSRRPLDRGSAPAGSARGPRDPAGGRPDLQRRDRRLRLAR